MATSTWTYWNTSSTDTCTSYNTSDCWSSWNTTTSSSTATSDNTWYYWTVDSTTDATVRTNDSTWTVWNEVGHTIQIIEGDYSQQIDRRRIRVKAKRARIKAEKSARKHRARQAMKEVEKQKAEEKAKELLLDLIGPEQMEIYNRTGRVFVKGTRFDWLLQTVGSRCNLRKLKKDKVHDLCIHIDNDQIPKTDQVIGYLLSAKFNEEHLDRTANLVRTYDRKSVEKDIKEAANA